MQTASPATWAGQPFHWGPTRYHYYWVPSESPIIQQFVDLYQVIRLDTGDPRYALSGQPDPYVSSPVPNYPVNSLLFWWTDVQHPVLGPRTRGGIALILAVVGLVSLLALLRSLRLPAVESERESRVPAERGTQAAGIP